MNFSNFDKEIGYKFLWILFISIRGAMTEHISLIVKHFPSEMSIERREELLRMFGAIKVKCMPDRGKMKFTAFAVFPSHDNAKYAISKLHQMKICGQHLSVEYVKNMHQRYLPHESDYPRFQEKQNEETTMKPVEKEDRKSAMEEFTRSIHGIAPSIGLEYLPSTLLRYRYPDPTPTIIANISHALAAVPKFYTQVLHLMNKMNLPAPFGPVTPTPPLAPDIPIPVTEALTETEQQTHQDSLMVEEMEVTSSEESELESDLENRQTSNASVKRNSQQPKRKKKKVQKLQHLRTNPPPSNSSIHGQKTDPSDIFEPHSQIDSQKKIQFNIKQTLETDENNADVEIAIVDEETGFGIIERAITDFLDVKNSEQKDEPWDDSKFISVDELRKKRISAREMKIQSVFKNYNPGEPTFRLYIKNLARQVEEKDLRYIFGRFIDPKSEADRNMFDVRLMKEGRMKGQAFVTLAQEKQAIQAVKETNGFILHTKPMVVQYARSAKPKEIPQKPKPK